MMSHSGLDSKLSLSSTLHALMHRYTYHHRHVKMCKAAELGNEPRENVTLMLPQPPTLSDEPNGLQSMQSVTVTRRSSEASDDAAERVTTRCFAFSPNIDSSAVWAGSCSRHNLVYPLGHSKSTCSVSLCSTPDSLKASDAGKVSTRR
jgi:hypothetical protein